MYYRLINEETGLYLGVREAGSRIVRGFSLDEVEIIFM